MALVGCGFCRGLSFVLASPGRLVLAIGAVTYSSDAAVDGPGEDEGLNELLPLHVRIP